MDPPDLPNRLGNIGNQNGSQQDSGATFPSQRKSNVDNNFKRDKYEDAESDIEDGLDTYGFEDLPRELHSVKNTLSKVIKK